MNATLPCLSTTNEHGMPCWPDASNHALSMTSVSHTANGTPSFLPRLATNSSTCLSVFRLSVVVTGKTTRPSLACSLASSLRCGIAWMHGPHQIAQKSRTYTLPASNPLTSPPLSHFCTVIGGAASPTLRGTGLPLSFSFAVSLAGSWAAEQATPRQARPASRRAVNNDRIGRPRGGNDLAVL